MLNAFSYYQTTLCETSKAEFSIVFIISMTNFSKCYIQYICFIAV